MLQSGKSADLAGAFGGAGSQSTFGPRGTASLLSKITTTLAVLFMLTSLLLWLRADIKSSGGTAVKDDAVKEQKAADITDQETGEVDKGAAADTPKTGTEKETDIPKNSAADTDKKEETKKPDDKSKEPDPNKGS